MRDWKPNHYNSVSPYLICTDAEAAIEFIISVFGGEKLRRFDRSDGSLMHAEVRIDDTVVMLGGVAMPNHETSAHVHVYVKDVDAVYARALEYGAASVQEPTRKNSDDDRRCGVRDTNGNTWWIATQ